MRGKKASRGGAAARSPSRIDKDRTFIGVVSVLLVVIVWIVFGQTLGHQFVNYDDHQYVYENPRITNGFSLDGIGWAFTHVHSDNWHPLTTISHMLDCQMYGLQPWGHHLTNILLHSVAAVLLFLALRRLTGFLWPSAFIAALFAIHPLRVESVAWVSERKDVLSGVFFMLTLWAYARYVRSARPSSGRYTMALVFFALGLMCKPTLVTLPFLLLLLDYWPLRRFASLSESSEPSRSAHPQLRGRRGENLAQGGPPAKSIGYLLVEKIPFFALSAGSCVVTLLVQEKTMSSLQQLKFGDRVGNAMASYVAYIGQMIWPVNLAVFYPHAGAGLNGMLPILAFLVLLVISALFFLGRAKYAFLLVGWLWFLGTLVPMIGVVQVGAQARADRYTYLSQIGLYLLVTLGALALFSKWPRGREILIAAALLIVTTLMVDSHVQASYWRNSEMLWNHALANTTDNYLAYSNLGGTLIKEGRVDEAIVDCRKALEIKPDYPDAHINLGHAFASKSNWTEAVTSYRAAIRAAPKNKKAHGSLAVSLAALGETDEAIAEFREALRLDPDYVDAHYNLATVLLRLGRRDEAVIQLRELLRLKPNDTRVKAQLHQLSENQAPTI